MTAKEQNKLVGIFLMAHGGLQAVVMLFICVIYGVLGASLFLGARQQEEQLVGMVFIALIVFVVIFTLVFVLPQLIGGWKLIKERPNARTWGIIASIVSCLSFPIGTAAGIFGLVFLFGETGKQYYLGEGSNVVGYNPPSPPRPNSWQ